MAKDIILDVRVIPRSSRSEIVGQQEGVLKVRIAAAPVDGAANLELVRLLNQALDVPKSAIQILSGATSRNKRVRVVGASEAAIERVLRG